MLQAMNTGHDGSLTTIHANSPRDALARTETLVLTAGFDLPLKAIRDQIASAFDLIIQVNRLVDGRRRITHITEVGGWRATSSRSRISSSHRSSTRAGGEQVTSKMRPHRHPARVRREARAARRDPPEVVLRRDRREGGRAPARQGGGGRRERRRAGRAAAIAALAALLAAPAAWGAAPATEVTGVHAEGPHTVRVLVQAAGDLATSDVEADLGGRFAFVESVRRSGPVRRTDLVFAVDTSRSMAGAPIAAATAAGRRAARRRRPHRPGRPRHVLGHGPGRPPADRRHRLACGPRSRAWRPDRGRRSTTGSPWRPIPRWPAPTRVRDASSSCSRTAPTRRRRRRSPPSRGACAGRESRSTPSASSPRRRSRRRRSARSPRSTGGELAPTRTPAGLEPIVLQLSQARLATTYAVDVSLPRSSARTLHVRVRGGRAASVRLPDGVSGASPGFWSSYGDAARHRCSVSVRSGCWRS